VLAVTDGGCTTYAELIKKALLDDGVQLAEYVNLPQEILTPSVIEESLDKLKSRGRSRSRNLLRLLFLVIFYAVIIFCFDEADDAMDFLLTAGRKGMLNANFTYLTYWYSAEEARLAPWTVGTRQRTPEELHQVKEAFVNVKTVRAIGVNRIVS
jgi:hypothetical protein